MYKITDTRNTIVVVVISSAGKERREPDARNIPVEKAQRSPERHPRAETTLILFEFFILKSSNMVYLPRVVSICFTIVILIYFRGNFNI